MGVYLNIMYWTLGVAFVIILASGLRIVRPVEKGLVERFGKYKRTAEQGLHYIIPFVDKMYKVDITENMVDIPPQKVITKDDLNADVDAVVYFKVLHPKKAIYNAEDYYEQITSLARTTLRDIIGKMTLSDANAKRDQLNGVLEKELDKQTDAWGIDIVRVELQRIEPPSDVQNSMNQVVIAEREKKAAVDFATAEETKADGVKRAEIKKAEGARQSLILKAEGQANAIREVASAKAAEIKLVNESAQKYFKKEAQTLKALETAEKSFKKGTKYVIDSQSNLVNVMSDVAGVTIPLPK